MAFRKYPSFKVCGCGSGFPLFRFLVFPQPFFFEKGEKEGGGRGGRRRELGSLGMGVKVFFFWGGGRGLLNFQSTYSTFATYALFDMNERTDVRTNTIPQISNQLSLATTTTKLPFPSLTVLSFVAGNKYKSIHPFLLFIHLFITK